VVPFGRSFDEYIKCSISESNLKCAFSALVMVQLAFNAEATRLCKGNFYPIYQFSATEIMKRFYEVVDNIIDQKATPASWWSYHKSPEDLRNNRVRALNDLLTIMTRKARRKVSN